MEIIGFCGRKESGKSLLSDSCAEFGYETVYMATPLKNLVADLIGVRYEDLEKLKTVESEYPIKDEDIDSLHSETGIPYGYIKEKMSGKVYHTVREILQHLGTDVIRNYDNDWHVKKTREMILEKGPDAKVCVGDVRFPNEVAMIRELGGDIWFITRPRMDNVSNHRSETSVRWKDADFVIVNNGTKDEIVNRWKRFVSNYKENVKEKKIREEDLWKDKEVGLKTYNKQTEKDKELLIEPWIYRYNESVLKQNIKTITPQDETTVTVVTDNGYVYDIVNPLEMEELKMHLKMHLQC